MATSTLVVAIAAVAAAASLAAVVAAALLLTSIASGRHLLHGTEGPKKLSCLVQLPCRRTC